MLDSIWEILRHAMLQSEQISKKKLQSVMLGPFYISAKKNVFNFTFKSCLDRVALGF